MGSVEIFNLIVFWSIIRVYSAKIVCLNILIQTIICYFITEHCAIKSEEYKRKCKQIVEQMNSEERIQFVIADHNEICSTIYIIIFKSLFVCLFVWPLIDSETIKVRNMKLMSLEPVWPEMYTKEKIFGEKWPEAKLPRVKVLHPMLSYEKNFSNIVINVNW